MFHMPISAYKYEFVDVFSSPPPNDQFFDFYWNLFETIFARSQQQQKEEGYIQIKTINYNRWRRKIGFWTNANLNLSSFKWKLKNTKKKLFLVACFVWIFDRSTSNNRNNRRCRHRHHQKIHLLSINFLLHKSNDCK